MLAILAATDVFVLASHHEGFPLSVMEALGAGVPVVVARVGEPPHVVRDGVDCLLVAPGDGAGLATALRSLVTDPVKRARLAASAGEGGGRFDIRVAARRLEGVYQVLAHPPARRRTRPVPIVGREGGQVEGARK